MKEFNEKEYNKLCAEFLGFIKSSEDEDFCFYVHSGINIGLNDNNKPILRTLIETNFLTSFIKDWNWIMKVVEKIEEIGGAVCIGDNNTIMIIYYLTDAMGESYGKTRQLIGETKKEAIVQAIWEFLNWYKENKQIS